MAAEQQTRVKGASGGNRFAAACGQLRQYQYMMGQGSGRGAAMATMGLMPGADGVEAAHVTPEERIKNTMELLLFPQRPGTLMDNSHQSRILEPERAQLTIFYDGRTFVLDDFPADKADQLMQLARSFAAPAASDDELVCPSMPAQILCVCSGMPRKSSLQSYEMDETRSGVCEVEKVPGIGVHGDESDNSRTGLGDESLSASENIFVGSSRILEPERAQLTIFYDGRTFVLDDFPADKADQLMQLARSFAAPAASDDELVCPSMPVQHFLGGIPALQNLCVSSALPRKASLHRFLEQRKGRIAVAEPYLVAPARAAK
ncbi:hypothetical protein QYE76_070336 [Lolium multiflorum]|uniref:Protein TIFY n=1 Tax=Lolium multiflorum TaxID=4521 RepID=A0AAD8WDJ2_LOLMU|nr:hypothetical protein QYE76_070336 [Lolium multiflorum]